MRSSKHDLTARKAGNVKGGALNLGGPDTKLGTHVAPSQTKVIVRG